MNVSKIDEVLSTFLPIQSEVSDRLYLKAKIAIFIGFFYTIGWFAHSVYYLLTPGLESIAIYTTIGGVMSIIPIFLIKKNLNLISVLWFTFIPALIILFLVAPKVGGLFGPAIYWIFVACVGIYLVLPLKISLVYATFALASICAIGIFDIYIDGMYWVDFSDLGYKYFVVGSTGLSFVSMILGINGFVLRQRAAYEELSIKDLQIQQQLTDISNLLNNMKQAVFTVNSNLIVQGPVSSKCSEFFDRKIEGCELFDLLFRSIDKKSELFSKIESALVLSLGEPIFQWEAVCSDLPKNIDFKIGDRKNILSWTIFQL